MTSEKHNCTFIHIPKTGGTSIIRSLMGFEHNSKPLNFNEMKIINPDKTYKPRRHPLASTMNINLEDENHIVFTVIRDPVERFLSALRFRMPRLSYYSFSKVVDIEIPNLKIIRYENLQDEWNKIFPDVELGRSNIESNKRKTRFDGLDQLPDRIINRITKTNPYEAKVYGYI